MRKITRINASLSHEIACRGPVLSQGNRTILFLALAARKTAPPTLRREDAKVFLFLCFCYFNRPGGREIKQICIKIEQKFCF